MKDKIIFPLSQKFRDKFDAAVVIDRQGRGMCVESDEFTVVGYAVWELAGDFERRICLDIEEGLMRNVSKPQSEHGVWREGKLRRTPKPVMSTERVSSDMGLTLVC